MKSVQQNTYTPAPQELPLPLVGQTPLQRPVRAAGQAAVELKPQEAIDAEAGMRDLHYQKKSLAQRHSSTGPRPAPRPQPRERPRAQQSGKAAQVQSKEENDDDERDDWQPVRRTLDLLRQDSSQDGRAAAEAMLGERFDPVQSYNALLEAARDVDGLDGLSAYKKKNLKGALNEMMSDMMQRSSGALRKALQETEDLHGALEVMADSEPLPSTREMRFLIGAKQKGNQDAPLTALTMLKALIRNFGAEHCMSAMDSLRSRMMTGF
ncbi:hypothetical protein [Massilia sp. YIM B04103]|uniref:hypothetical protein n=1 Tax=Massilia sp. YIM B04103 TaxID=2963106 RepID=UPI00210E11AC|nr:hypothetical protein [Massilia sp. YIM B04103]